MVLLTPVLTPPVSRTFLGSVSDYCLHQAPCPVLVVRKKALDAVAKQAEGPRKIAVAVDDSEGAAYTFDWALENVAREGDLVLAIHVRTPAYLRYPVAGEAGARDRNEGLTLLMALETGLRAAVCSNNVRGCDSGQVRWVCLTRCGTKDKRWFMRLEAGSRVGAMAMRVRMPAHLTWQMRQLRQVPFNGPV
jgi:hypothetical protein